MNPYRNAEKQPVESSPAAPFDYTAQIDANRKRVIVNAFWIMVCLLGPLGILPYRWLDAMGPSLWILEGAILAISIALAIRGANQPAATDVEAYEERLLGAERRKRERRRRAKRRARR